MNIYSHKSLLFIILEVASIKYLSSLILYGGISIVLIQPNLINFYKFIKNCCANNLFILYTNKTVCYVGCALDSMVK